MINAFNNVSKMLNLSLLSAKPNSFESVFFEFVPKNSWLANTPYRFLGDGEFKADAKIVNSGLNLKGLITIPVEFACSLCGAAFKQNLFIEFDENFSDQADDEHFKIYQNKANLNEFLNELVVLNIPTQVLCRPDCKGVCHSCGQNLNEGECACKQAKNENNPFAIFKGKFN